MTKTMSPRKERNSRNKAHDVFSLVALLLGLCVAVWSLVSCGPAKPVAVVRTDSVRVEIRERIVRDTAYFQLPAQSSSIVTKDTTSVIELDFAKSTASVRDGFLHHSLETKPETLEVPVYIPVHDTLRIEKKGDTIYIEVERQPTKWESFLEVCGWILIGIVGLLVVVGIAKLYFRFR